MSSFLLFDYFLCNLLQFSIVVSRLILFKFGPTRFIFSIWISLFGFYCIFVQIVWQIYMSSFVINLKVTLKNLRRIWSLPFIFSICIYYRIHLSWSEIYQFFLNCRMIFFERYQSESTQCFLRFFSFKYFPIIFVFFRVFIRILTLLFLT